MPDGLVASGSNKITFFGHYGMIKCIHLMGENNPHPEKFFVYDSVLVHCPYKFFDIEKMAFDSISCGRHPSFHDRIKFE